MANNPLKPLIKGMFGMVAGTGNAVVIHSGWQSVLEEARRNEKASQAAEARRKEWRREQEAAELKLSQRRKDDELRLTLDRARGHETQAAIQAKKRPVDVGAAFVDVRRRAESGDPNAQNLLGRIYLRGMDDVLSVNPSTFGLSYYAPAASALTGEKEFARSSDVIRFVNMPQIPANPKEAARWFERAAQQGHREAQSNLAQLFHQDLPDPVAGYRWVLLAAGPAILQEEQQLESHTPAWLKLTREDLLARLTPAQKAEAERQAKNWKPTKEHR